MKKSVLGLIGLFVGAMQVAIASMLIFSKLPKISDSMGGTELAFEFRSAVQIAYFGAVWILTLGLMLVFFSTKEFSKKKQEINSASRYVFVLLTAGVLFSALLLAFSSRALLY